MTRATILIDEELFYAYHDGYSDYIIPEAVKILRSKSKKDKRLQLIAKLDLEPITEKEAEDRMGIDHCYVIRIKEQRCIMLK